MQIIKKVYTRVAKTTWKIRVILEALVTYPVVEGASTNKQSNLFQSITNTVNRQIS